MHKAFVLSLIFFFSSYGYAQEVNSKDSISKQNSKSLELAVLNTKSPLKAGLYSSVLPGLGQYYNEQYWKIPIVLGAIGTGIGVTLYYDDLHQKYRSAYIDELNGNTHQYSNIPGISAEILAAEQDDHKRNRDYAIVITTIIYILNVVDATVDAHLYDIRRDQDLSLEPIALNNPSSNNKSLGLALKFNF